MAESTARTSSAKKGERDCGIGFAVFSIRRWRVTALFWLVVAAAFAGALWPGEANGATKEETPEIAVIAPLSGELAPLGEQLVEAARFAAREQHVAIQQFDEGEGADGVLNAVKAAAANDQVVAAIGPVRRRHAGAAARKAQRLGLPMISFSSVAGVERQGPLVFRARLSPEEQTRHVALRLIEERDVENLGVLAPKTSYGDSVVTTLIESVNRLGATAVAMGRYEEDATDFRPALKRLTGSRAYVGVGRGIAGVDGDGLVRVSRDSSIEFDALVIADSHATVARLLPFLPRFDIRTGAAGAGASVQLVGLAGWRGDGLQRVSEHVRGAIFFDTFGGVVDGGEARHFVIEYREVTDRDPTTPEAEIFDLVSLVAAVIGDDDGAGPTRQSLAGRLASRERYEGVTGRWEFDAKGAPLRTMHSYEIGSGGQWMPARRDGR